MLRFYRSNKELIKPILFVIIVFIIGLIFKSFILSKFLESDLNNTITNIGIGFILTAYTIFLGDYQQISVNIRNTKNNRKSRTEI